MKKIDNKTEKEIIKKYTVEKLSQKEISKHYGICDTTVSNILKRNNIKARTNGGIDKIDKNDLYKYYYEKNMTLKEISNIYNVTIETIRLQLIKNGLYNKKKYNAYTNPDLIDDYFEKIDNQNKAYFLGYLATDGNVYDTNLRLELNKKDKIILDTLNKELHNNTKLQKHKNCLAFSCKSKKIVEDLSKYNIVPNKTFTVDFPILPKDMIRHYIRGLIDGDGWTTKFIPKKRKTYCYAIGFCGNEKIVHSLKNHLVNELKVKDVKISYVGKICQVKWSSKKDIIKIRDYIYKDAELFLERKYDKIKNL